MSRTRNFLWLFLMTMAVSCSSPHTGHDRAASRSGEIKAADSEITGIASREVMRRQEQIRRADAAALEANRASAEGDNEAAIQSYREALDSLPTED